MQEVQPYRFDASILAGQISVKSMTIYKHDFNAYMEYAGSHENALKPEILASWIIFMVENTNYSPNTINRMAMTVRSVMKQALIHRYIDRETYEAFKMVKGVKSGALKERMRIRNRVRITPKNMRDILNSIDDNTSIGKRNKALIATLASSGLRIFQFTQLKQEQIIQRDGNYLLRIYAETGKYQETDREAYISNEAVDYITAWLAVRPIESEYIFTACGGRGGRFLASPLSTQKTWELIKKIAEPYVPGVRPHDFRRFVGTQLIKLMGIHFACKALGHKNIQTTLQYDLSEMEAGATNNLF